MWKHIKTALAWIFQNTTKNETWEQWKERQQW